MTKRIDIDDRYKWNIEAMYPDENLWEEDLKKAQNLSEEFLGYAGRLTESASILLEALQKKDEMWLALEKAYVYARMRRDEDNSVSRYQGMTDRCHAAIAKVQATSAFFTPELLAADEAKILLFLEEEEGLKLYEFYLKEVLRQKQHILTAAEENILAQLGEVLGGPQDIFTMLNNADLTFGTITDEDGKQVELTHGNYIRYMESHDRNVRKEAFTHMYETFKNHINTISSAYSYNVKTDVVGARLRKFDSARAAALSGDNIPGEVYDHLIQVVNSYLPVLHRYLELRKKILELDELKMHDVYVPLVKLPKQEMTFEETVELANKALAPLGEEYLERMNRGISAGWIDVFENEGKTSGAYSFGSYDSMPYILMNFAGTLKDAFTLVHEMGHSMHSSYTREVQPFIYGSHSIFTAEVASTVNESLLMHYLMDHTDDPEMKKYLINMHIEEFRTTLFRQTMFAEFEDLTHKHVEAGNPLTADYLNDTYEELNRKYFGDAVSDDEYIRYEWSRIPHFYNAFYVYQYATGYSAATAISEMILKDSPEKYKEFLTTGDSNHPIELLKIAGVDMAETKPIEDAMKVFEKLVDEFEELLWQE